MLRNYFKASLRNLINNKLFSVVNILGLTISLAGFGIVFLFVLNEANYDTWVKDSDRIFRLNTSYTSHESVTKLTSTAPVPAAEIITENIEEVSDYIRLGWGFPRALIKSENNSSEEIVWRADANLFSFFDITFIQGNNQQALVNEGSVVISAKIAKQYFGAEPALGKTLTLQTQFNHKRQAKKDYQITGVFQFPSEQTHLNFDIVTSLGAEGFGTQNGIWARSYDVTSFLKLDTEIAVSHIENQLPDYVGKYVKPAYSKQSTDEVSFELENLKNLHLSDVYGQFFRPGGNPALLYLLSTVALLILIIACINFSNLQVSRALSRLKEMAVRQVLGARRAQVILLLVIENIVLLLISIELAFVLIEFSLPHFNAFLGHTYSISTVNWPYLFLAIVVLCCGIALITSLYPAALIFSQRPSDILRSSVANLKVPKLGWAQDIFLTLQLTIVIVLIVSTVVISSQVKHSQTTTDLGFSPEDKLMIPNFLRGGARKKEDVITKELSQIQGVTDVSFSSVAYGKGGDWLGFGSIEPLPNSKDINLNFPSLVVSDNFFSVYKEKFIAGRDFSSDHVNDEIAFKEEQIFSIILNEAGANKLGWLDASSAIGKRLKLKEKYEAQIIGVVANHPVLSFKEGVKPYMYVHRKNWYAGIATLLYEKGADETHIVSQANLIWDKYQPDRPMTYSFMTDDIASRYASDQQQATILAVFAALAIIIAGFGAYSLSAYTVNKRAMEVCIRKIYGATGSSILSLFFVRFSKPALIASVIAWPIAFYLMSDYLSEFTSRIDLHIGFFIISSAIVLLSILLAISTQVLSVMRARPVDVLHQD